MFGRLRLIAIAALDENYGIGRNGALPWHLAADFLHFKTATMGHTMIMGRKTFDSMMRRKLPGRRTLVITGNQDYGMRYGVDTAESFEEACRICLNDGLTEAFVVGGASIFRQALPYCDKLVLTMVKAMIPGMDTFFPRLEGGSRVWSVNMVSSHIADSHNDYPFEIIEYRRVSGGSES